jgi:hypothetical protein
MSRERNTKGNPVDKGLQLLRAIFNPEKKTGTAEARPAVTISDERQLRPNA